MFIERMKIMILEDCIVIILKLKYYFMEQIQIALAKFWHANLENQKEKKSFFWPRNLFF